MPCPSVGCMAWMMVSRILRGQEMEPIRWVGVRDGTGPRWGTGMVPRWKGLRSGKQGRPKWVGKKRDGIERSREVGPCFTGYGLILP
jgi:hypothetical protein